MNYSPESNYSHDLHGALVRGYARRTREGITHAVKNAAGWMRPYDPGECRPDQAWSMALTTLLEYGRSLGIPDEELREDMERALSDHAIESRDRAAARSLQRRPEDPIPWEQLEDWDAYDAMVDAMSPDDARSVLKREARLRYAAQSERP